MHIDPQHKYARARNGVREEGERKKKRDEEKKNRESESESERVYSKDIRP